MDHSPSASVPSSTLSPVPAFVSTITWSWLYTTGAILLTLLALEQSVYRYKKRHLPGAKWKIPIIGKFADSLNPTLDGYKKTWDSGALSAISVFNMYTSLPGLYRVPFNPPVSQLYRYGFI
jgi:C-22 sterol desaturase